MHRDCGLYGIIRDIWFGQAYLPRILDARGHQIVGSLRLGLCGCRRLAWFRGQLTFDMGICAVARLTLVSNAGRYSCRRSNMIYNHISSRSIRTRSSEAVRLRTTPDADFMVSPAYSGKKLVCSRITMLKKTCSDKTFLKGYFCLFIRRKRAPFSNPREDPSFLRTPCAHSKHKKPKCYESTASSFARLTCASTHHCCPTSRSKRYTTALPQRSALVS